MRKRTAAALLNPPDTKWTTCEPPHVTSPYLSGSSCLYSCHAPAPMQTSSVVRERPKSSFMEYSSGRLPFTGSLRSVFSGDTNFTSGGMSLTIVMEDVSIWFVKPWESHTSENQPPSPPFSRLNEKESRPSAPVPGTTTSPGSVIAPSTSGRDGFTETVTFDPSRPTIAAVFV